MGSVAARSELAPSMYDLRSSRRPLGRLRRLAQARAGSAEPELPKGLAGPGRRTRPFLSLENRLVKAQRGLSDSPHRLLLTRADRHDRQRDDATPADVHTELPYEVGGLAPGMRSSGLSDRCAIVGDRDPMPTTHDTDTDRIPGSVFQPCVDQSLAPALHRQIVRREGLRAHHATVASYAPAPFLAERASEQGPRSRSRRTSTSGLSHIPADTSLSALSGSPGGSGTNTSRGESRPFASRPCGQPCSTLGAAPPLTRTRSDSDEPLELSASRIVRGEGRRPRQQLLDVVDGPVTTYGRIA